MKASLLVTHKIPVFGSACCCSEKAVCLGESVCVLRDDHSLEALLIESADVNVSIRV